MKKRVLGLDLSLTSTGICVWNNKVLDWANPKTRPDDGDLHDRIDIIVSTLRGVLVATRPALAIVEEAAFSRGGHGQIVQLAELAGCVKRELRQHEVAWDCKASNTIKLFATGSGKADKTDMLAAAVALWPDCPNSDDVADAFHMARYGHEHYMDYVEP